jgi:hypothetical protein
MEGKKYKVSKEKNKNWLRSHLIHIWEGDGGRHECHSTTKSPGFLWFREPKENIWKVNFKRFQEERARTDQDPILFVVVGDGRRYECHSTTRSAGFLRFREPKVNIREVNIKKFQRKRTRTHQDPSWSIFFWRGRKTWMLFNNQKSWVFVILGA